MVYSDRKNQKCRFRQPNSRQMQPIGLCSELPRISAIPHKPFRCCHWVWVYTLPIFIQIGMCGWAL